MAAASHCLPCERSARAWQVALCGTRVRLRADNAPAQFVRFVTVGVISSGVYFGVFLALRFAGEQVANLVGAVLSSMLANELHRRLTFHAGDRVGFLDRPGGRRGLGRGRPDRDRRRRWPPSTVWSATRGGRRCC